MQQVICVASKSKYICYVLLRQLCAYSLLCILGLQFFYKAGVVAYYYAHKEYIAEVLCINKSKPELECDGKCYLKNKLAQSEPTKPAVPQVKYEVPDMLASTPTNLIVPTYSLQEVLSRFQHPYISPDPDEAEIPPKS